MLRNRQILITTGMTGGHFYPAVAFADSYLETHPESQITFLLPRAETAFSLEPFRDRFRFSVIPIQPLPRKFSKAIFLFPLQFLKSIWRTGCFMGSNRFDALISFGSYGAIPAVLVAWLFRIPIVVHEQNRIFGWANLVSSFLSRSTAVSFPETLGFAPKRKVCYTGFPLRKTLLRSAEQRGVMGQNHGPLTLLVLGGSQGSRAVNHAVFDLFSSLTPTERKKFAVIHITGQKDFEYFKARYETCEVEHEVYAYHNRIEELFKKSHCVIGRAGAGTIFEMAAFGMPGILIPYPYAYSHQSKNAHFAASQNGVVVCDESELNASALKKLICQLANNRERLLEMSLGIRKLHVPDADKKLVTIVDEHLINL